LWCGEYSGLRNKAKHYLSASTKIREVVKRKIDKGQLILFPEQPSIPFVSHEPACRPAGGTNFHEWNSGKLADR